MEIHFRIIGGLLIALAFFHVVLPKHFNWKKELSTLSLMNKQMMHVHAFFIAFMVLLMGILCLTCTDDLVHTAFGKKISLGMGAFWVTRFIFQFLVYSPKIWRGKRMETVAHIVFSLLWAYLSFILIANFFMYDMP
jgi:hypothetical protein